MKTTYADSQKWLRPNGRDATAYSGAEKWSNPRWAWEFLRRNADFQQDCLKVDGLGKTSRSEVAQKFHLNRYKPYWEKFRSVKNNHKRAKFVTRNLKFWTCLKDSAVPPRTLKVKLKDGEILVRLPVWAAAKLTSSSLPTLLKSMDKLAHLFLKEFLSQEGRGPFKQPRNHDEKEFLPYLRVLDLEAYCASLSKADLVAEGLVTQADRFVDLFGSDADKKKSGLKGEGDGFRDRYQELKARASDLTRANYLHIAALEPKFPEEFRKKKKKVKSS